jgi:uncharacterized protein (TIGR00297 family)
MTQLTLAPLTDYDVGAIASAAIALVAWRARALSASGALAAVAVGTATYGALGWHGAAVLLAFFTSATALGRVGRARKKTALAEVDKPGARDAAQVLANGLAAAVCAVLAGTDARFALAFAGAFAAANADTWGTEIGALARGLPRSIVTLRPVATGLSGGVTLAGTVAEAAGALLVALVALPLFPHVAAPAALGIVTAAGFGGALFDSVLGATVQTLRWCGQCQRATEREPHPCGANTERLRGFLNNDAVNLLATSCGAALAFALAR